MTYKTLISKHGRDFGTIDKSSNTFELSFCAGSSSDESDAHFKREPVDINRVKRAAYVVATIEFDLREAGYPDNVWRKALNKIKTAMLADSDAGPTELVSTLNRYRKISNSARNLPRATAEGECGGAGPAISFVPVHSGDQISIIPEFWYQVCTKLRSKGVDPDDPQSCDNWVQVSDGQHHYVTGHYFVRTVSSGGKSSVIGWDVPTSEGDRVVKF